MSLLPQHSPNQHVLQIVSMVAKADNRSVFDLPPLFDAIDPDSLEGLLQSGHGVTVSFEYCGYRVDVSQESIQLTNLRDKYQENTANGAA